ncbi:PIM2 kinase, partial [Polypterus senegalus]
KVPLEVGLLKRVCAVPAGPNIIQMSEYILGRRYMFIFMELLESYTSLEDVIYKKTGPLSEEKAKHAFRQIVQAVLHCHSRGVFHNDIKPNNIMYQTTTGQIKLIDFGYGDLLKEKYYPHAPGTPAYWPPEWYLFRKYKAEPVTVWTLGITLFELLCGNRPFKEKMEILECKISYTNEISGGQARACYSLYLDKPRVCLGLPLPGSLLPNTSPDMPGACPDKSRQIAALALHKSEYVPICTLPT